MEEIRTLNLSLKENKCGTVFVKLVNSNDESVSFPLSIGSHACQNIQFCLEENLEIIDKTFQMLK